MNSKNKETLVCALGGLGEVGKNMYCIEFRNQLFVIDAGILSNCFNMNLVTFPFFVF